MPYVSRDKQHPFYGPGALDKARDWCTAHAKQMKAREK